MKSTRKLASILLAVMVASGVFTGCGNSQSDSAPDESSSPAASEEASGDQAADPNLNLEGFPIVKEPITLKLMGVKQAIQGPWEDLYFFQKMEEMTNIHFEFDTPSADVYTEKKNIAFASGDYPDLFFGGSLSDTDEVTYGENQKVLIPLSDLIETYAPNFTAYMEENPDVRSAITHPDGEIYALPHVVQIMHCLTPVNWFNSEWCERLGLSVPTTTDELYTVLKAFKDEDANGNGDPNDEIPLSGTGALRSGVLGAFGLVGNGVEVVDGVVRYNPITENYKAYLEFANKLYAEGLLDNETFTQTEQQLKAKGVEMRLGMFQHAAPWLVCPPERDDDYSALLPLTSPVNDTQVCQLYNTVGRGTFAITSTNEHPEATMRWVDYLWTEEGNDLVRFGEENVHWKWTDETKTAYVKIVPDGMNAEEFRGGQITPDCGTPLPVEENARLWALEYNDKPPYTWKLNERAETLRPFAKTPFPQVYFNQEQSERLAILNTDIQSYVEQMEARFITGEEPLSNWDTYVETLKQLNVDELIQLHQEVYDDLSK